METYAVIKILSLVAVWGIPASLVLALVIFIILGATLAFGGLASRVYEAIGRHKCSPEAGLRAHASA